MQLITMIRESSFKVFGEKNAVAAVSLFLERKGLNSAKNTSQLILLMLLKAGEPLGLPQRLIRENRSNFAKAPKGREFYDENILNLITNRIFDMPEVLVDEAEPKRINILVPAFSINSISAGFFGVFNVALHIESLGYKVRLVLFDNFHYNQQEFRKALEAFPSFSSLLDRVEVEYIGERRNSLAVSPSDGFVATVWYSAYFAEKILSCTKSRKGFLYLIQDYESQFYAASAMSEFAEKTYSMKFAALVSTDPLHESLYKRGVLTPTVSSISFNNACSANLPVREKYMSGKKKSAKKFIFYSRPSVNRNMFELAALSIIAAHKAGIFVGEWEFYGMGIGDIEFDLGEGLQVSQVPRMTLQEYQDTVWQYDLCLSLMASPHPSIVPFDLAGAGAKVVTNSYREKNKDYFAGISGNIHVAEPTVSAVVSALADAISSIDDLDSRYENAIQMNYPRSWEEVWNEQHDSFLKEFLGE